MKQRIGKKKKNYIYGLDGLRALAILGVTLFHVFPNSIKGGYLGVCLFFVITGFLLSVNSKKKFNIVQFYKKRFVRIYPSLIVVVLVTCGICFFFVGDTLSGIKSEILSIFGGYNNWWQIGQNSDYFTKSFNNSPFTHFWFLGIELQYYLIWPILFLIYKIFENRKKKENAILIFTGLSVLSALWMLISYKSGQDVTPIYYGTHTRIFSLLLGSVLGFMYTPKKRRYASNYKLLMGGLFLVELLITLISFVCLDGQSAFLYRGGMFILTLIFMNMVSIVTNPNLPYGKWLESPLLKWISKYSFPIYLWQYPIIFFFTTFGWIQIPFYQILELLFIVLFAYGLEQFLHFWKMRNRILAIILVCCTVVTMVFGCLGIVRDDGTKEVAMKEMQKEIVENEKKQEEAMKKKQAEVESKKEEESKKEKEKELTEEEKNALIMAKYTNEYCLTEDACMIGDSILLRDFVYIERLIPNCIINGSIARQASEAYWIYDELNQAGYVGQTVVISLGTNGGMSDELGRNLLDLIGEKKDIFWVNCYVPSKSWMVPNNEFINAWDADYPNLHVIDWVSICLEHPEYLDVDGIHPNNEGCAAYAQMIYDAITTTPHITLPTTKDVIE